MTVLAMGKVSDTKSDIFEVTRFDVYKGSKIDVTKITFFNTNAADQTVILYLIDNSGTEAEIVRFELLQNERGECLEPSELLDLENGDRIQAETTTADAVNYVVYGNRK